MTNDPRHLHSDPAFRVGLEALGRVHVGDAVRDRVWRLAADLAGPGRPVNARHLQAANQIVEHVNGTEQVAA
jgi:hypothetical protein